MRDDFHIEQVEAIKVGLTMEQAQELDLPVNTDAKKKGSRYRKFAARFGDSVHELEAVDPRTLELWLDEAVRSVLDITLFNEQVNAEKKDAVALKLFREEGSRLLRRAAMDLNFDLGS
jgi:hypothetical protein